MSSQMLFGSGRDYLHGDATIPGVPLPKEIQEALPTINKAIKNFGLTPYPYYIEMLTYDEISEIAAYGGFPVRYPHWSFGMEYEELARGYEANMHRISEMVINSNPCIIYCLDSNTFVDQIDVICHALGHSDFFRNNIFFAPTDKNVLDTMANHGSRIQKYIRIHGREKVVRFIDHVRRIETLIDCGNAWKQKQVRELSLVDDTIFEHPVLIHDEHEYMDQFLNPKSRIDKIKARIRREEKARELHLFGGSEKDIFRFIKDNADLTNWQKDIISMLYDEAMYFEPQRATKVMNEGWASFVDYKLLAEQGLCSYMGNYDSGIIEYAEHKYKVLGGKYSMNPYKLGFELFMDIEDRWNKGKFGTEYNECKDAKEKENWDMKLGLGMEKVFEVRELYNDYLFINEFFTEEFCHEKQFYFYKRLPNGEWRIANRNYKH